jgi:hypothetical protein
MSAPIIEGIEALFDPVHDEIALGGTASKSAVLTQDTMVFIDKLSMINVVRHSQTTANHVVTGGSRDELSRFQIPCSNHKLGCSKTFGRDETLRVHLLHCKFKSIDSVQSATDHAKKTPGKALQVRSVSKELHDERSFEKSY